MRRLPLRGRRARSAARCCQELIEQLPSVAHVVLAAVAGRGQRARRAGHPRCTLHSLPQWLRGDATFEPEWLPFDHPLWVVYSSGTTGCRRRSCTATAA
jgi:acetoacetyl-CoA synthetase